MGGWSAWVARAETSPVLYQAFELEAKQLQLLRDAIPALTRVAVLTSATSRSSEEGKRREATAKSLKIDLMEFPV